MKKLFKNIALYLKSDSGVKCKVGRTASGNKAIRVIGITAQSLSTLPLPLQQIVTQAEEIGFSANVVPADANRSKALLTLFEDSGTVSSSEDLESAYDAV